MRNWWKNPGRRFGLLTLGLAVVTMIAVWWQQWLPPLPAWLVGITLVTFFTFGYDKAIAETPRTRIPEIILLLLTFIGGTVGALGGMFLFRHKTAKRSFQLKFWLVVLLQVGLIVAYYVWLRPQLAAA
ncbi:MAG: DUF1294 domain-containing protein [Candidatus Promineifilaceae bacterium]